MKNHILVAPVSGGALISQLAMYSILPEVPDIIFASSGGNIASYIALAADYDIYAMERILRELDSSMLLRSWWGTPFEFLPSWLAGYSRGSYYDRGIGVESLFQSLFTPDLISRKEIWTGVTLCSSSKCQLFCNKSSGESKLKVKNFTLDEFNTLPLRYLDRNISDISAITLASASIPSFVPPVVFNGDKYVDGGASYSSPLTPMSPILRYSKTLHIDYLNSFDVISANPLCQNTMTTLVKTTTTEMIHSMILQDRSNGIELIRNGSNKLKYIEFCCSEKLMDELYQFRKKLKRSFLELFPSEYRVVQMDNYKFEDARDILWSDRKKFKCRFWWSEDKTPHNFEFSEAFKRECKDGICIM